MEIFKGLQPELVWSYFEEICKIPRPSKKEEKIAAWLMEFAKKHQLEARQDEAGNVLITKPATPGMTLSMTRLWALLLTEQEPNGANAARILNGWLFR